MNQIHTISTTVRLVLAVALLSVIGVLAFSSTTHAQAEDYSYTIGEGDGVTNLILDYAEANDKNISPARAYRIAQANGQMFLDNNLTVESDLPYTDGIGAFENAGVTITAADNEQLFNDLDDAVSDSPDADEDDASVPAEDTSSDDSDNNDADDESANDSENEDENGNDEANDDEGAAADVGDGEDDENSVWPWIIGIAAVFGGLYYINQSREE